MTGQKWPQRWAEEIPRHSTYLLPAGKHFTFEDVPKSDSRKLSSMVGRTGKATAEHQAG